MIFKENEKFSKVVIGLNYFTFPPATYDSSSFFIFITASSNFLIA